MARPRKEGVDWFSHDVDLSNDEKIEALEAVFGNDGYAFYCKTLERMYRAGGKLDISASETRQILARKCNITANRWEEILEYAVRINGFYWNQEGFLTSKGVEKRMRAVLSKREYMANLYQNRVSEAETPPETTPETPVSGAFLKAEGCSIVEKSKEEEKRNTPPSLRSAPKGARVAKVYPAYHDPILENPEIAELWSAWLEFRTARKVPNSPRALEIAMAKLRPISHVQRVTTLKNAVERGYKGLFPEQYDGKNQRQLGQKGGESFTDRNARRLEEIERLKPTGLDDTEANRGLFSLGGQGNPD